MRSSATSISAMLGIKAWNDATAYPAHGPFHREDIGIRPAAGGLAQTDVGALRAGARVDGRSRRHRHIAKFAAELGNVERVEVLPFHQMGRFKWETLRIPYALDGVEAPSPASVEQACGIFEVSRIDPD